MLRSADLASANTLSQALAGGVNGWLDIVLHSPLRSVLSRAGGLHSLQVPW